MFDFRCSPTHRCKMAMAFNRYTAAVIVLCYTLVLASASNQCSPPIPNCSCIEGTLNCQGLTKLPVAVPVDITEFIFDKCVLGDLTHVTYDRAEVLLIRDSSLTDISDGALLSLASLKTLDLGTNQLVSVRKGMFRGLASLTDLSLRSNGIKAITDDTFANLPNLTSVNLNGNPGLHVSDNVFGENKRLKHVHMSRCELETVPIVALSTIATLTTLELDWNPLGTIPSGTFAKLAQLQTLNLFGCSLTTLADGAFAGLDQLFMLNLAENKITGIPDGTFDNCCHALQNLYLNDNQLMSLPGGESGDESASKFNWQNVRSLKLGGNPWSCDCDLQWMRALDLDRIDHENLTYVSHCIHLIYCLWLYIS